MELENEVKISFSPGSHVTVTNPQPLLIAMSLTAGFVLGFVLGWLLARRQGARPDENPTRASA